MRKHECFQYGAVATTMDPRFEKCGTVGCSTMRRKAEPKGSALKRSKQSARPTQSHRVLSVIADGEWHCGVEFVRASPPILRYSARVADLKERGHLVESRPCKQHDHAVYEFRLRKEVSDASQEDRRPEASDRDSAAPAAER